MGGGFPRVRQDDGKLVAPIAGRDICAAHLFVDHFAYQAKELVAHQMAVRIVDLFELVEIEENHGDGMAIAVGALHFMSELFVKVAVVVEFRERVLIRKAAEPLT